MGPLRNAVAWDAVPDFAMRPPAPAPAAREAPPARALLIDPDPSVGNSAAVHMLRQNGLALDVAETAEAAVRALGQAGYALVILELASDSYDGVDLCRRIIEQVRAPVLVWSRQASPLDQVAGLELGAEDFVAKTAHPLELLARCRAILRRGRTAEAGPGAAPLAPYSWVFEARANGVRSWTGARVWLRPTCAVLLSMLCATPRKVVTRGQMVARLTGEEKTLGVRTVDVLISRLRRSLESCDHGGRLIRTVQAQGYFLNADVQALDDGATLLRGELPSEEG